jgi:hypothetical protein
MGWRRGERGVGGLEDVIVVFNMLFLHRKINNRVVMIRIV